MKQAFLSDLDVYRLFRDHKWDEFAEHLDYGRIDLNRKYSVQMISGDLPFDLLSGVIQPETNWLLKKLLEKGANPNKKGEYDFPIGTACEQKNYEAMELLISAGANVNVSGGAPLFFTAEQLDVWSVERLLKAGADATKLKFGKKRLSPIWAAASCDRREKAADRNKIISLLVEKGCKLSGNEIHWPVYCRDVDLVRLLISIGCPLNEFGVEAWPTLEGGSSDDFKKGETPLTLAASSCVGDWGGFPHAVTSQRAKVEIVSILLAAGADPNAPNARGETPLVLTGLAHHFDTKVSSPSNHNVEIAKMLIQAGAEPDSAPRDSKHGSAK